MYTCICNTSATRSVGDKIPIHRIPTCTEHVVLFTYKHVTRSVS